VRRRLAFLGAAALVTAGCGGSAAKHAHGAAPAVPWTAAKPPQLGTRTPAPVACRASDLSVPAPVKFVPRFQGGIALVTLRNTGSRACRLTGRPQVRFVATRGPQQVEKAVPPTPTEFPDATYPQSSLLALQPGESAALTITWDNWCERLIKGKPHLPPSAIRITLPGGRGSVAADYNAVAECVDPTQPSIVGVSRFQPALVPDGRPWTSAYFRAEIPDQPVHARRGGVLRFRVVLTNISHTRADFARCPAYEQQLVPRGALEVFELNCTATHALAPGKSVAFAMRVDVPKSSPLGANGLFWELDPFGAQGPEVHARVTITR